MGTEKVEDVLRKLFPDANVTRMDSDALKRKDDYRRILGDFRRGKIDILVGTQMIAKGLHFPRVTLVGIVMPIPAFIWPISARVSAPFSCLPRWRDARVVVRWRARWWCRPFPRTPCYSVFTST